jgi:hypothetical protein
MYNVKKKILKKFSFFKTRMRYEIPIKLKFLTIFRIAVKTNAYDLTQIRFPEFIPKSYPYLG